MEGRQWGRVFRCPDGGSICNASRCQLSLAWWSFAEIDRIRRGKAPDRFKGADHENVADYFADNGSNVGTFPYLLRDRGSDRSGGNLAQADPARWRDGPTFGH